MGREHFLNKTWHPYPPARSSNDFVYGRVVVITGQKLKILGPSGFLTLQTISQTEVNDPHLGPSIPLSFLILGDVVAYQNSTNGIFLLSPRLRTKISTEHRHEEQWSVFLKKIEIYFEELDFLHLRTPYLVSSPGVDHHIDFMKVKGVRTQRQWYLPTSPEIHLKKYLCRDYNKIFEIKSCFRDDLDGPLHQPEFTMLEWYRTYVDLETIKKDLIGLLEGLSGRPLTFTTLSVAQCFESVLNFKLHPDTNRQELLLLAQKVQVEYADDDDWNDLFFRIFLEKIEPFLAKQGLCFLQKFPPQQASLSRLDSEGWSERFEFFANGVELANAYHELNDPMENKRRFQHEAKLRQSRQAEVSDLDFGFFEELLDGMPPSSGIALGLSRLYQCWFSEKKPAGGQGDW